MLWKYKKCYTEANEDVPDPETCTRLVSISAVYTGDISTDPTTTTVSYILCGDNTNTEVIQELIVANQFLRFNQCIKTNSLFVDNVNIIDESTTSTPFWSVTANFDNCGNGCTLYEITSDGNVSYLDCDNQLINDNFLEGDQLCANFIVSSSGHIVVGLCESVPIPIESGVISSESNIDSTGVCSFELNSVIWYQNDVAGVLSTGSLVFQNSTGTIPFDGDNQFYRVKATASSDTYFARINAGIIIEIGIC